MNPTLARAHRASHVTPQYLRALLERSPVTTWWQRLRDRVTPSQYVDWSDLPDEPESPYRARLTVPKEDVPDEIELGQREVVLGVMKIIYEVRCTCGKRWFNPRRENVQLCPRCDRAVLIRDPD